MKIVMPAITKTGFEDVEAELLPAIAPHLASVGTFALHKGLPTDPAYRDCWFVSSVETGYWVAYAYKKAHAIRKATERLAPVTAHKLGTVYRKVNRSRATGETP